MKIFTLKKVYIEPTGENVYRVEHSLINFISDSLQNPSHPSFLRNLLYFLLINMDASEVPKHRHCSGSQVDHRGKANGKQFDK